MVAMSGTGERQWSSGLLSHRASFTLLVSGPIGSDEIGRLIEKLQIDRAILWAAESEAMQALERQAVG